MKNSQKYQNGKSTPLKQESYRYIASSLFAVIGAVRKKHSAWACKYPVWICDLYAGPGRTPDGELGSPLIACELAQQQSYKVQLDFYEHDSDTMQKLAYHLTELPYSMTTYRLFPTDNSEVINRLKTVTDLYGFIYADPSNADLNEIADIFCAVSKKCPRVDLIFNYAAASWKRKKKLDRYQTLLNVLKKIDKKRWLIRELTDMFQWTMLLGTNYLDFKASEKKHWFDLESERGKEEFMKANYTHKELESSQ